MYVQRQQRSQDETTYRLSWQINVNEDWTSLDFAHAWLFNKVLERGVVASDVMHRQEDGPLVLLGQITLIVQRTWRQEDVTVKSYKFRVNDPWGTEISMSPLRPETRDPHQEAFNAMTLTLDVNLYFAVSCINLLFSNFVRTCTTSFTVVSIQGCLLGWGIFIVGRSHVVDVYSLIVFDNLFDVWRLLFFSKSLTQDWRDDLKGWEGTRS